MTNYTYDNVDNYVPQFSTRIGNEFIESCLLAVEKETPDLRTLLLTLVELAKLIKTVDYDHQLLNNVISENQLLSQERDMLKLAQISQLVQNMEMKLEKAERDCYNLQAELDVPQLDVPELNMPQLNVPQFSFNGLTTDLTLLQLAS